MNISVTEDMYRQIREGVRAGFHSSVSEYIRALVRRDRNAAVEREQPQPYSLRPANDYLRDDPAAGE